jgi:hypothetical protein
MGRPLTAGPAARSPAGGAERRGRGAAAEGGVQRARQVPQPRLGGAQRGGGGAGVSVGVGIGARRRCVVVPPRPRGGGGGGGRVSVGLRGGPRCWSRAERRDGGVGVGCGVWWAGIGEGASNGYVRCARFTNYIVKCAFIYNAQDVKCKMRKMRILRMLCNTHTHSTRVCKFLLDAM